ncbi:MAG: hypothetical protein ACRDRQ_27305 [Pseudonocardiaceae bacterium]
MDELVALAGWTPALTEAQASRPTEAATGGASREQFTATLHGETGLGNTWVNGFLIHPASTDSITEKTNRSSSSPAHPLIPPSPSCWRPRPAATCAATSSPAAPPPARTI